LSNTFDLLIISAVQDQCRQIRDVLMISNSFSAGHGSGCQMPSCMTGVL